MARIPLAPLAALLAATAIASAQDRSLSGSRPNVLFIFSDDHAAHAISAYGSTINETPGIDRLAAEGMLFRNCFCGNSICGPSRATILTGKHSHANGFMRNGNRFDGDQMTFPKLLQKAGYQTAMIGKWHLSSDPQGFDHWMVLPGQGQYYNPDFLTPDGRVRIEGFATDITTDLAIDWLEKRDADKPFVLMCQHKAPHRSWMPGPEELGMYRDADVPEPASLFDDYSGRGPAVAQQEMEIDRHMYMFYDLKLVPDEEQRKNLKGPDRSWKGTLNRMTPEQREAWEAAFAAENLAFAENPPTGKELVRWKYQRYIKNYLRCVAGVDKSVSQLLAWLDAHPDVKKNTVVVYSSDQGFYLGDHGWYDKRWMYEESLRMPFVVRWPERIAAGSETEALAQNIDFAPTFLDLAGVKVPREMHGESLVPVLEGRTPDDWRDAIYYHYYESHAVHQVAAHYGVRTRRHKLIHFYEPDQGYWELYDLEKDPDEVHNVVDELAYGDVRKDLTAKLAKLRGRYVDITGALGNGAFEVTAGLASVAPQNADWRVRANARGGYALKTCEPMRGVVTFRATIRPVATEKPGNGQLIVTSGNPRARQFRCGLDFANKKLVLQGPGLEKPLTADLEADLAGGAAVEVAVDLGAHEIVVRSCERELRAKMPPEWDAITAYGYGASNATAVFGPVEIVQ